jgi:hypothetical protein
MLTNELHRLHYTGHITVTTEIVAFVNQIVAERNG